MEVKKTAMILEGGALRGVYTSGVLDVMMLHHLKFSHVVGISAGSLNGLYYVANQIGKAAELNLNYVRDSRYMGVSHLAKEGSYFNFDFVFQDIFNELIPFDFDFLQRGGRVSKTAAGLGGLLKLVVCMKKSDDGRCLEKHSVNRTLKKVVLSIFEEFDNRNVDDSYHISISHAFNEETASKVKKALVEKYPNATIELFDLSPVFITQGGPKCCAIQAIKIVK